SSARSKAPAWSIHGIDWITPSPIVPIAKRSQRDKSDRVNASSCDVLRTRTWLLPSTVAGASHVPSTALPSFLLDGSQARSTGPPWRAEVAFGLDYQPTASGKLAA